MARDSHIRPLSDQGKKNHERIFGPPKKFRGVIRYGADTGEKRMDADWSRQVHNANNSRKLEKDEQKFTIPGGNHETLYLKKSWTDKQKRTAIADHCNAHGYAPGDGKPVVPDDVNLYNG